MQKVDEGSCTPAETPLKKIYGFFIFLCFAKLKERDILQLLTSAETALIFSFFVPAPWASICSFKGVQIGKSESLYVLMRDSRIK